MASDDSKLKKWYRYSTAEYFANDFPPDLVSNKASLKNRGYSFVGYVGSNNSDMYKQMFLPLSPQNLTITEHYATNITATIGGTVEEHSPNRYFDISIAGTTGYAPANPYKEQRKEFIPGRKMRFRSMLDFTLDGGVGYSQIEKIKKAADTASDLLSIFGDRKVKSGINIDNTGYMAFIRFAAFLRQVKQSSSTDLNAKVRTAINQELNKIEGDAFSLTETGHGHTAGAMKEERNYYNLRIGQDKNTPLTPLYFVNWKDDECFSCVINTFSLTRSAENPMLYMYEIHMRAYSRREADFILGVLKSNQIKSIYSDIPLPKKNKNYAKNVKQAALKAKEAIRSVAGIVEGWWR
jgi:hypothetical protein